ncbi:hypothetical protein [Parabacteroides chinchillae]
MPEKILKTLWDESDELFDETGSTRSVLSDDYTSGDVKNLTDDIENKIDEEDDIIKTELGE